MAKMRKPFFTTESGIAKATIKILRHGERSRTFADMIAVTSSKVLDRILLHS